MKYLIKTLFSIATFTMLLIFTSCETNKVTELLLDKTELSLMVGDSIKLTADVNYTGSIIPSVVWSSNDETIITANNGIIKALKVGTAVITATASDKSASCTVTVTNEIKPVFTKAEIEFWGNYYNDNHNNFILMLTNDNDTLYLDLNTDLYAVSSIPAGKYTMISEFESFDDFIASTLIPAFEFDDESYGSWFFDKTSERPLEKGELTVGVTTGDQSTGDQYSFSYDLTDYDGIKISGTFTGTANFADYSNPVELPANFTVKAIKNKSRRTFGLFK